MRMLRFDRRLAGQVDSCNRADGMITLSVFGTHLVFQGVASGPVHPHKSDSKAS